MSAPRRSSALAVLTLVASVALGAGGCVSILPKQPPVQLYQFGQAPPPSVAPPVQPQALSVILSQVTLPRAAIGDGILTLRGDEAAYIAGARWLTPAALMLQEEVQRSFEAQAVRVRLIDRSQLGAASALLRLDGLEFDARYDPATPGPPVVVVSLRATLARADGRKLVRQCFIVQRPASEDRVSAIVSAYDAAVGEVLGEVVGWTESQTPAFAAGLHAGEPAALPPPAPPRPFPHGSHP